MSRRTRGALGVALAATTLLATACASAPAATTATQTVAVTVGGGHDTDPRDGGRPVVLIAAGLGVPTEVFRAAFSGVTPARGGAPDAEQVQRNKAALLAVLAPYGITNDALDRVSDHYRYMGSRGEMWPTTAARGTATIRNGKVVSVTLTEGGSGYSSTPTVTVPGHPSARVTATVAFGTDLATNGRVTTLRLT